MYTSHKFKTKWQYVTDHCAITVLHTERWDIQRIYFNKVLWESDILPKQIIFHDCCFT